MSKHRFAELMDDLGTLYDKDVSVSMKRLYWEDLGDMPIEIVEAAMRAHRKDPDRGRFFPKPADLLAVLSRSRPAQLSADEAWALCLLSFDEAETVAVNDVILAARAAAMPVWNIGDKTGARMAFRGAYERGMSRLGGARPRWSLSLGWDTDKRAIAAEAAVSAGLLAHDQVAAYLPAPAVTPAGEAIAGLLTGAVAPTLGIDEATRARLAEIRAALDGLRREPKKAPTREEFAALKRSALAAVEARL